VIQPNGTVLKRNTIGDEYHSWLHDAEGYAITQSPDADYIHFDLAKEINI
jgi:hypothetical protein